MTDDLVRQLRQIGEGAYVGAVSDDRKAAREAADRIEKLEMALVKIGVWNNFEDRYQGTINELIHNALEGKDE